MNVETIPSVPKSTVGKTILQTAWVGGTAALGVAYGEATAWAWVPFFLTAGGLSVASFLILIVTLANYTVFNNAMKKMVQDAKTDAKKAETVARLKENYENATLSHWAIRYLPLGVLCGIGITLIDFHAPWAGGLLLSLAVTTLCMQWVCADLRDKMTNWIKNA